MKLSFRYCLLEDLKPKLALIVILTAYFYTYTIVKDDILWLACDGGYMFLIFLTFVFTIFASKNCKLEVKESFLFSNVLLYLVFTPFIGCIFLLILKNKTVNIKIAFSIIYIVCNLLYWLFIVKLDSVYAFTKQFFNPGKFDEFIVIQNKLQNQYNMISTNIIDVSKKQELIQGNLDDYIIGNEIILKRLKMNIFSPKQLKMISDKKINLYGSHLNSTQAKFLASLVSNLTFKRIKENFKEFIIKQGIRDQGNYDVVKEYPIETYLKFLNKL